MALFHSKKRENTSCGCGGGRPSERETAPAKGEKVSVKILGSGCAKCNRLEAEAKAALEQLGIEAEIDHVTDFAQIAAYGVMSTPALVVDEEVIVCGRVLKAEELMKLLQQAGVSGKKPASP